MCWRRRTERVRTVSPSRLTSVPAIVLCLVVSVGFCCWLVSSCFGSSCVVVSLFSICWRRRTERVRTVSPSRLTSVPAIVWCLVVGVGFSCWLVSSCFGSSCVVVSLFSLVHHTLRHT